MPKFNFAITTVRGEKFEATECHSFDEAIKIVEKGIYDRNLHFQAQLEKAVIEPGQIQVANPGTSQSDVTTEPRKAEPDMVVGVTPSGEEIKIK